MSTPDLNIVGFERRVGSPLEEYGALSGTAPTVSTTTFLSGTAALRVNVGSGVASAIAIGRSIDGAMVAMGRTARTQYTLKFRFPSLPSITTPFAIVITAAAATVVRCDVSSAGAVTLVGTSTSGSAGTVSTNTWHRLELDITSNGTAKLRFDSGTEVTVTANNATQDFLGLGRLTTTATAIECFYDDVGIGTGTDYISDGRVLQAAPTGAGSSTGWTSGTGSTFAEVDETAHDGDTSYISASSTQDNAVHLFTFQSTATIGVTGVVSVVKAIAAVRTESTTGTSTVGVRIRSNATDSDTTGVEWTTSYAGHAKLLTTDPNGGGAWTNSAVDSVQAGVFAGTLAQNQRCTAVHLQVWDEPVADTGNRRRRVLIGGTP